jgi:hypothetical protein
MSPAVPATVRKPLPGMHMTGFAAVVSVHMTILSLPVKHAALTEVSLLLSMAKPAQFDPEVIVKPPNGPQELIVVGGAAGCGCT